MKSLTYAIVGTGALGGYYGGMLAKAKKEVHFLFNSDYEWVRSNGLRVDSVQGDFVLPVVNAYNRPEDMPKCDVVLVCMKTTSESLLKSLLAPIIHAQSIVLLIQNGYGNEAKLKIDFPNLIVGGGLGFICSSKVGPGHIVHQDFGKLTIGIDHGASAELLTPVIFDLIESGISAEITENLELSRWKKLVWNVPYNGLCVVLGATTEDLMNCPSTYQLIQCIMQEVVGAANACGFLIEDGFIQAMLDSTKKMKPYAPSMKLDFDHKRPMEIDAIYARTLAAAEKVGFAMPKVSMLKAQLEFLQG